VRGRIRQLKPDLFIDDEFWMLEQAFPHLPLLRAFQGLWCHADREGRFEWKPLPLKSQIAPYWSGDFSEVLDALAGAGLVACYVVAGRKYGAIRNFAKHQRPNNKEPASELPPPPEGEVEPIPLSQKKSPLSGHSVASTPTPNSQPQLPTPTGGAGGREPTPRTYSMPCEEPPADYLEQAVIEATPVDQAKSTWAHYWGQGLPPNGVERLYAWLLQRAREKAISNRSRAAAQTSRGGKAPGPTWEPNAKHRAFCKQHNLPLEKLAALFIKSGLPDQRSTKDNDEGFGRRLMALSRGETDPILGSVAA